MSLIRPMMSLSFVLCPIEKEKLREQGVYWMRLIMEYGGAFIYIYIYSSVCIQQKKKKSSVCFSSRFVLGKINQNLFLKKNKK